jgi:hypothetical protein
MLTLLTQWAAISTSKVLLVPYEAHHVLTYHDWMQDPVPNMKFRRLVSPGGWLTGRKSTGHSGSNCFRAHDAGRRIREPAVVADVA